MGSYFGKKGLSIAGLDPKVGLIIRLTVSLIIVTIIAFPKLGQITQAFAVNGGKKGLLQLLFFEGIVAGTMGMLFYYGAIKHGDLTKVTPLAFATPLWGFLLGWLLGGEQITALNVIGAVLAITGVVILAAS